MMFGLLLWWVGRDREAARQGWHNTDPHLRLTRVNKKRISDPSGKNLATKLQRRNNDPNLLALMFLISPYTLRAWWYDAYDCFRRISLTAMLVLITSPGQRLTIAVYLSFLYVLVHCTTHPYENPRTNGLALGAHVYIFTVFFSGQQLLVGVWSDEDSSLGSALVAAILLVTSILIYLQVRDEKISATSTQTLNSTHSPNPHLTSHSPNPRLTLEQHPPRSQRAKRPR